MKKLWNAIVQDKLILEASIVGLCAVIALVVLLCTSGGAQPLRGHRPHHRNHRSNGGVLCGGGKGE